MIHDKKRVNALRAAAKAGIEALEELRNKTTDSGFHERLGQHRHLFTDIESFFLSQLENREDRTSAEEANWLNGADRILNIANRELKESQRMFKDYGPSVMLL